MAITKYTGNGGLHAMRSKLIEVYDFKSVNGDQTVEDSCLELWVSDELFIGCQGGSSHGWADVRATGGGNLLIDPFIKGVSGTDTRTWTIVTTSSGVAFYMSDQASPMFISDTINSSGDRSMGMFGKNESGSWHVFTDGISSLQTPWINVNSHGTYTQLVNIINPSNDVYFPNLYTSICTQSTNEQILEIDGTKYYCYGGIALKE